jgi:RimJ/RimL family protein N-acetyltransferase
VIVPEPGAAPIGTIGVWEQDHGGERIHEVGWLVLPEHQGQGVATRALGLLLERLRADPRIETVHAFPGVTNAPSNALCRRFGFRRLEEHDAAYAGRTLRTAHWELDVSR